MPVQVLTKTSIPHTGAGLNITDMSYQTMTTGAGNGSQWDWHKDDIVVLKNATGGAAVYTIKLSDAAKAPAVAYGATVPDPTNSVTTAKTELMRLDSASFKDANGKVTVECDVAAQIAVLTP